MRARDIRGWPVMKKQCASCPFGKNGDKHVAAAVLDRTLFKYSQICHHPVLAGKKETQLCRGQRDIQLQLLYRIGLLEQPTDECFNQTSQRYLEARDERQKGKDSTKT